MIMNKNNENVQRLKNDIEPRVKQKSAPEIVVDKLIKQIESNELKPGQKLHTQNELSKIYKVGMSSIREATNVLEVMGYLEVIHGSGTYVSKDLPMSKTMMEQLEYDLLHASAYELFELREVIECHAVTQAAKRADPLAIEKIRSVFESLRQSMDDRQAFLECDLNFHLIISNSIDLEATAACIRLIFEIMHKHFNLASTTLTREYREKAIYSAEQVVYCLEKGEETLAVRCMRRHLDAAKHALVKIGAN